MIKVHRECCLVTGKLQNLVSAGNSRGMMHGIHALDDFETRIVSFPLEDRVNYKNQRKCINLIEY